MASWALCQKGLWEQHVALSNGGEHVRCPNGGCGYFFSLADLPAYERVLQLEVANTFTGQYDQRCQQQKPCFLRVSHSLKNGGRPYFTCRER